jgi:competence protein ComEA
MAEKALEFAKLLWLKVRDKPWLIVFAITFLIFLVVGLGNTKSLSASSAVTAAAAEASEGPVAAPSEMAAPQQIFIQVAGAVVKPGVYVLPVRARVYEAIALAGGFTKSADQASVNLVRELVDGEQILVLELYADPSSATGIGGIVMPNARSNPPAQPRINLNRAGLAELDTLPGVGPALAQRIVDWRTANGPFKKIADLTKVSGIGEKLIANLKSLVVIP